MSPTMFFFFLFFFIFFIFFNAFFHFFHFFCSFIFLISFKLKNNKIIELKKLLFGVYKYAHLR